MNTSGSVGYTVAVPIRRESYHVEHDATGRAYAARMDEDTEESVTAHVQTELPNRGPADVHVTPGYLAVDATPDLRTPPGEYQDALSVAVRKYNDRVDHASEKLQIDTTNAYVGVYRPENAQPLSVFVDRLTMEDYHDKQGFVDSDGPVFEWTRDDPRENAAGGPGRHVAFECVVQVSPETYAAPGGMTRESDTFRWTPESEDVRDPVEYMKHPRASRILGQWGSCMAAAVWPTHARVTVHTGATVSTPRGVAKQAHRYLTTLTPNAVRFEKRGRVLPIEPGDGGGFEAWVARSTPDVVDGQPIQPEEPEEPEGDDGDDGGLLSWRS